MTNRSLTTLLSLRLSQLVWPLLALLLCTSNLHAAEQPPSVTLDGNEQGLNLQPYVSLLHDPSGKLTLEQVEAGTLPFETAAARRDLNFGFTPQVLWLRVQLRSNAPQTALWRVEFNYSALDQIELFQRSAQGLQRQQGGDSIAAQDRNIGHRNPVFSVQLAPGEERSLYFRAQTTGNMTLSLAIWQSDAFQRHSEAQYVVLSIYFGMLLALASYNLLLFSVLRERAYLFYVLFVCGFAGGMLSLNGFGAQYLWPDSPYWNNHALPFLLTLSAAFAMLFVRDFLDARQQAPAWHRVLGRLGYSELLIAPATLAMPLVDAGRILSVLVVLNCLLLFSYGLSSVRRRLPGAGIFLLAWSLLMIGAVIMALRNFALLPSNFITLNAMQIGSSLEILLLSFGLAARFNQLKQQKNRAQQATLEAQQQTMAALQAQEQVLELRVTERTEALATANELLRELALKDPLTGLANRTALKQQLEQTLHRAQRRHSTVALMLLDLDGFKSINDRLGHEAGDQVLLQVAQNLLSCARETDLVARLGGDEFVLLCEDIQSQEHAGKIAERFLQAITSPIQWADQWLTVEASIGIALNLGEETESATLLRRADQAMYQAKAEGRNCIRVAGAGTLLTPT